MKNEHEPSNPHEPVDLSPSIHLIIEMYADLNELSRRIGFDVTVTISKVPRKHFENIMDFHDEFFDGYLVADDPLRPFWVKRFVPSVAIYTCEPPEQATIEPTPTEPIQEDSHSDGPDKPEMTQRTPKECSEGQVTDPGAARTRGEM